MRTSLLLFTALFVLVVDARAATPSVSLGQSFALALKQDGTAVAWGNNFAGELGDGSTSPRSAPVPVAGLTDIGAIGTGNYHSLAIKRDGTLWAWGANNRGQLGDGTTTTRLIPVQVSGMANILAVAGGDTHTLALRSDGTVWAWGGNSFGQLGDGTTTNRTKPTQVVGLTGVAAIASRYNTSLALKSDGTVWAWGDNVFGQLGDGSTTNRPAPVRVSGLTGVRAISTGGDHSLALTSDGSVWGWGNDLYGQLCDGATTQLALTPLRATLATGVATISAGYLYTAFVKNDGTVWTAGGNFNGVLGIGSGFANPTVPVRLTALAGVVAVVTAGESNTVAIKKDGTVLAWGLGVGVGDGTTVERFTPVSVLGTGGTGILALGASAPIQALAPAVLSGGIVGGMKVSVTATASFPPQYVGTPIFLFAFAPAPLVHAAEVAPKDGPACVLAQITPSGFQSVAGASNLSSFGNNVINAATQSISMITNVLISQVAGSTLCVGVGNNGTQATAAGQYVCPASVLDTSGFACQPGQTTTTLTGGATTKTLGSRATVSPTVTHYGGFELKNAATVYILIRGNSLGSLGVTQSYLDAPRVRLYNSQGQDLIFDGNGAGFNGCVSNALAQGAVVSYYTSVRGQPPNARDACVAQNLAAGAYTFTVTPSTKGATSQPNAGEILFEVTLGAGGGSIAKTLGSRATVSQTATLYGGFEIASNATVYILVRGNSLSTLGVTSNYLDAPRVRLYDSLSRDLIGDSAGAGFNGCVAGVNSATAVVNYYTSTRNQPPHPRDACTANTFSAGVYTFSVTPSSGATTSSPSSGEVLFEVTLQ
jgi:alpha-tubulin suppressor-like RCC1 family protein